MVLGQFPGGIQGRDYHTLFFLCFESWALQTALFSILLWGFATYIAPRLPHANSRQNRCTAGGTCSRPSKKATNPPLKSYTVYSEEDANPYRTSSAPYELYEDDVPSDLEGEELIVNPTLQSKAAPRRWRWGWRQMLVPLGLVTLFTCVFFMWIVISLTSMADTSWGVAWGLYFVVMLGLAICISCFPNTQFIKWLVQGLPLMFAFWISVGVLVLAVFNIWIAWAVAVVAYIPLMIAAICRFIQAEPSDGSSDAEKSTPGFSNAFARLRSAMTRRPIVFWGTLVGLLVAVVISTVVVEGGCISFYNTRTKGSTHAQQLIAFSTWASRHTLPIACPVNGGKPCHVYFSVGPNISNSVMVNAQTATGQATLSVDYVVDGGMAQPAVTMTSYPVVGLETRGARDMHSVVLQNLIPGSSYTITVKYGSDGLKTKDYRIRTGPATDQPFNFTSGGDAGNTDESQSQNVAAATLEPLFAMVGGDVAYGNNFRTCYRCWDLWLTTWEETMVTKMGYTVPIMVSIGNHDAGSNSMDGTFTKTYPFSQDDSTQAIIPLIMIYFPSTQTPDTPGPWTVLAPWQSVPYHSHVVGTETLILSLDSGYVVPYGGIQGQWIEQQFTYYKRMERKLVLYHVPIFPVSINQANQAANPNKREVPEGFDIWVPLFDKHHVAVAFENHVHTFKRSYPLVKGLCKAQPSTGLCDETELGTVFLGDGYWGINDGYPTQTQMDLLKDPYPIIAVAALRYHVWFMMALPNGQLDVAAMSGVSCPELKGQTCDGIFDRASIPIFNTSLAV